MLGRRHKGGHGGEVIAVAGPPPLAPVPVNGRLQLRRIAQLQLLAFIRVEVFHVPGSKKIIKESS